MAETTAVQAANGFSLAPSTLAEAKEYANLIASSDFVPNDFKGKPANVMVACQMGAELGLKPLQALQNIAVINGKPTVWGDAMIAIVRSRADCEYIKETINNETMTATCIIKRRSQPEETRTFSKADATTAGLWGNNTWKKYPKRMLQMRARAFALRDVFGDALKGFAMAEEVQDYEAKDITSQVNNSPEPEAPVFYSDEDFKENFPKWERMIEAGKLDADSLITKVSTKAPLTEEQENMVRAICPPVEAEVMA